MATTTHSTPITPTPSQHFCCRHCGHDVALIEELGGDLSYECQNGACGWAGSVDCPEALGFKVAAEALGFKVAAEAELETYAHAWDAARDAAIADLASFAAGWDAWAAELQALTDPEPPTPAPIAFPARTAQQRATDKAAYQLAQGVKLVRVAGGWLVPSGTRAAVIHRVSDEGQCSCEAGQNGKPCWHAAIVDLAALVSEAA